MFIFRNRRKRQFTAADDDGNSRHTKRGRPMKRAEDLAIPRSLLSTELQQFHQHQRDPKKTKDEGWSPLEQLPTELIQQIFFHCFEINLPKASLPIAKALSTESTYRVLILFAYFEDDYDHPVETKHFLPARYEALHVEAKVHLQNAILSCRWCTLDRIQACMPILSRLSMVQAWHAEHSEEARWFTYLGIDHSADLIETEINPTIVSSRASLPQFEDMNGMIEHFLAKADLRSSRDEAWTLTDFDFYLPRIIQWTLASRSARRSQTNRFYKRANKRRPVLGTRVLPNRLVEGSPWTPGKLKFLQLLRQGSRFVREDVVLEISADAVFRGMSNAIIENNRIALLTLLELHNKTFKIPLDSRYDNLRSEPSLHPLPLRLFHLAAKAGPQGSDLMWLLIRGGFSSVPYDDAVLTAWALRERDKGDAVAQWLSEHMSDIPHHPGRHLFSHGASRLTNFSCPSFAQELNYLDGVWQPVITNLAGEPCG